MAAVAPAPPTPRAPNSVAGARDRGRERSSSAELPDDFRAIDFASLWKGRDRTTQVESAIVRRGLARFPVGRTMEIGSGNGRLTPAIRSLGGEYIGVDQRIEFLRQARARLPPGPGSLLIEANAYHLPLVDGAASTALLARVYNFLTRPTEALQEIRRTLIGGGGLLMSCHPRPSALTLVEDLRAATSGAAPPGRPWLTFSRAEELAVPESPFPPPPRRAVIRRTVRAAGFLRDQTFGSGLEDSRLTRFLPAQLFLSMGTGLAAAPVFPVEWDVLRNESTNGSRVLPPLARSIACPRCRQPFGELDLSREFVRECRACDFPVRLEEGILRARYVAN